MTRNRHLRAAALLTSGLLIGALLFGPAGAHVGTTISHLWSGDNHLKEKVQHFGDRRWADNSHAHDNHYLRFGGQLPPGKSLRGTWSAGSIIPDDGYVGGAISFAVPLGFNPLVRVVNDDAELPEGCKGSGASPVAEPGYLCLFVGDRIGVTSVQVIDPASPRWQYCSQGDGLPTKPVCRLGVWLRVDAGSTNDEGFIYGTYAVRDPL